MGMRNFRTARDDTRDPGITPGSEWRATGWLSASRLHEGHLHFAVEFLQLCELLPKFPKLFGPASRACFGKSLIGPGPIAGRFAASTPRCSGPRAPFDYTARGRTRGVAIVQRQLAIDDDKADSGAKSV